MTSKIFEIADQERFAQVSGDYNPLHMDPLAARRTPMGMPVVHGIHTVLAGLEAWAATSGERPALAKMTVQFMKPVYVGDEVRYTWTTTPVWRCVAEAGGAKVMTLDLVTGSKAATASPVLKETSKPAASLPKELSFSQIKAGLSGHLGLSEAAAGLFPQAAQWLGSSTVGFLVSLSRLVGMECPGLQSLFVGFQIAFDPSQTAVELGYSVQSVDDRFSRVRMEVQGAQWKGSVDAAWRKPPATQPALEEIARQVPAGKFKGQKVLVVGGSRGIGEYTAKVAAAGGAEVALTYATGLSDAQRVQKEIQAFGGKAYLLPYDARSSAASQLQTLPWAPTHVYYYATGRIFAKRGNEFDPALLEEFRRFYVEGFRDLCAVLRQKTEKFSVFYPSSVAVSPEERPKALAEYAMAKEEGEALCANLKETLPGVRVTTRRLPRLPTDQTATTMPVAETPMDQILPWLLEFQG